MFVALFVATLAVIYLSAAVLQPAAHRRTWRMPAWQGISLLTIAGAAAVATFAIR